jgi:hypothetical protein
MITTLARGYIPGSLAGTGQRFHFLLVDLDLAGLLHLIAQVGPRKAQKFLLLTLQERIANLIALGGEIGIGRSLHFREGNTTPSAPLLMGPLISPASC